jgi:replicative DNA helicase
VETERSLLSAMIMQKAAIIEAVEQGVRPDDFHDVSDRRIYEAILAVWGRGDPVEKVTVVAELGGGDWNQRVLNLLRYGVSVNAPAYARLVGEIGRDRRLWDMAGQMKVADRSGRLALAKLVAQEAAVSPGGRRRAVSGGSFVFDHPDGVTALWGRGSEVLWAEGESLLIVGPSGVGKSTIAQQVVLARLGLRSDVLGWPVQQELRRVLYIAADRPDQARRSLRRMLTPDDREVLDQRLTVWKGPPPGDFGVTPRLLLEMAGQHDAGTVILDSVKDVALDLVKDEVGSRVNHAIQTALADGVQVLGLHHQVKRGADGKKPTHLVDVYGSVWITNGAGSVILLWGEPGDALVDLTHLKQPDQDVGPLKVLHDHVTGMSRIEGAVDLLAVAVASGGVTAQAAAMALYGTDKPSRNEVEKARRRLESLVGGGFMQRVEGQRTATGGKPPTVYTAAGAITQGFPAQSIHEALTAITPEAESPAHSNHGSNHGNSRPSNHVPPHLSNEMGNVCADAQEERWRELTTVDLADWVGTPEFEEVVVLAYGARVVRPWLETLDSPEGDDLAAALIGWIGEVHDEAVQLLLKDPELDAEVVEEVRR